MSTPRAICILLAAAQLSSLQTSRASLLTYWKFDEAAGSLVAADSANDNDASLLNFDGNADSDFDPAGGKFGGALHFDGIDDVINNVTGFQPGGNFTYAYFFKPDEIDYGVGHPRDDHAYSNARPHFSFSRDDGGDGRLGMYATFDVDTQVKSTTDTWANTAWHFVAFTYDGANFSCYVNGELEETIPVTGAHAVQGDGRFDFGGNPANLNSSFDGLMDELSVWDEALTVADLAFINSNGVQAFLDVRATDSDVDGLPDFYEQIIIDADPDDAIETVADVLPEGDFDNDGSDNEQELDNDTDPTDSDSDDDGLLDGVESNTGTFVDETDTGSDPNSPDTDGDSLTDGVEVAITNGFVTDPNKPDTDGDGFRDNAELSAGTDPTDPGSKPQSNVTLLFIGGQAGPTQGADAAVMAYLQDRYGDANVTYQQAGATAAGDENAFGVLVISSTPGSGDMRNKFHTSTTPVVNWEEAIADNGGGEFMITSGRPKDNVDTDHVIKITEDHPITAGFAIDQEVTITTGQSEIWWSADQQAPGSLSLAHELEDETRLFLTIVDAGGELNDGSMAEARRVMLGLTDNTFSTLTEDGLTLFGQSIDWALGISGGVEPLRILSIDHDTETNMITLTWNSKPGTIYSLDTSTDLTGWPGDIDDSIPASEDSDTTSFEFSADGMGGRIFFRIRIP